jgi:ATP-dependent Clp protease protease subunit
MGILRMPYILEKTPQGDRQMDIYTRLLAERMVFLTGEVNDDVADILIAQLFYLESQDSSKDIYFYINSPGGAVTQGWLFTTPCNI